MRRFGPVLFAFFLSSLPLFSQTVRVLVVPFAEREGTGDAWLGHGLEASCRAGLGSVKGAEAVSRRDRHLACDALGADLTSLPPAARDLRLAKALAAQAVLSGEYRIAGRGEDRIAGRGEDRIAGGEIRVTARLVSAPKGALLAEVSLDAGPEDLPGLGAELLIKLLDAVDAKKAAPLRFPRPDEKEREAIRERKASRHEFEYQARINESEEGVPQEFLDIERAVFEAVNRERAKAGFTPFVYHHRLAWLGRHHSRNMSIRKFFDFTDQDGLDSSGRKLKLAPELLGEVGQVIAYNYGVGADDLAAKFVRQGLESGSREELLNPDYNAVGVGVFRSAEGGFRYYCTIVPAVLLAEIVPPFPGKTAFGSEVPVRARFLGAFGRGELALVVGFPDKSARLYKKDGTYTAGSGFYAPQNWDGDFFSVGIKCDKGRGVYVIRPARGDTFYPSGFSFVVE